MEIISRIFLYVALLISLYTDIRYRKIKNWVIYPLMLIGLGLGTINMGIHGLLWSLKSLLFVYLTLLPFCSVICSADRRLLAAIGAVMGYKFAILSAVCSTIAYLIYALITDFKGTIAVYANLFKYIYRTIICRKLYPYTLLDKDKQNWAPYAACLLPGVIAAELLIKFNLL